MKLTIVALGLAIAMLGVSIFLLFQGREERARVDELQERLVETEKAAAESSQAVIQKLEALEDGLGTKEVEIGMLREEKVAVDAEQAMLKTKIEELKAEAEEAKLAAAAAETAAQTTNSNEDLTPLQRKILESPAIGSVQHYEEAHGFVVIDAGDDRGIRAGDKFAIRRDHYLVGKVEVGGVEPDHSIANVEAGSIPVGMAVLPGDSVIKAPPGL